MWVRSPLGQSPAPVLGSSPRIALTFGYRAGSQSTSMMMTSAIAGWYRLPPRYGRSTDLRCTIPDRLARSHAPQTRQTLPDATDNLDRTQKPPAWPGAFEGTE